MLGSWRRDGGRKFGCRERCLEERLRMGGEGGREGGRRVIVLACRGSPCGEGREKGGGWYVQVMRGTWVEIIAFGSLTRGC